MNVRRWIPWLILAALVPLAAWSLVVYPSEPDAEYPAIVRPVFNHYPPKAYRLAEPGDTLDRAGMYVAALGLMFAVRGLVAGGRCAVWLGAICALAGLYWLAAAPSPTFDGWHGWSWSAIANPAAPISLRIGLALAVLVLVAGSIVGLRCVPADRLRADWGLIAVMFVGIAWRIVGYPDPEPWGYFPRCGLIFGLAAFDLLLLKNSPPRLDLKNVFGGGLVVAGAVALAYVGCWVTWNHRPLERLRVAEPGRIYISAVPTIPGLEIAQGRHGYKTIINLFPESGPQANPKAHLERQFAADHGIRYLESPGTEDESEVFLEETLRLARDPEAWPILVHCHGCMDRTPAWMGIYRFVVQGKPLLDILQEIERHRGDRPKGMIYLLYNRVLPKYAPERHRDDPTARILEERAAGVRDPYHELQARAKARGNSPDIPRAHSDDPSAADPAQLPVAQDPGLPDQHLNAGGDR